MKNREFLKSNWMAIKDTDREKGIEKPDVEKDCGNLIALPSFNMGEKPFYQVVKERLSIRKYSKEPLTLEELSFLLWATQGVRKYIEKKKVIFRTVPSAGSTHPFDTYLIVFNIDKVEKGIYRYSGLNHGLCEIKKGSFETDVIEATLGQRFVGESAVVFVWVAVPYRTEWKYKEESYKTIAIDAGHVCQNLYLAATAIDCGTCAVAAYDQDKMDKLVGVDGKNEFVIYLAPVGKI
ncbi:MULTISPECIES: SagB/ThcOx family dehydrogenase [unclassified Thermosipho (in: thermotogales)]|uniref:SagB/ThcOx family dehydrogenase n=1 Tax=unclassified Thermosipho (in: thermotogales) TaxID=2676525 RepID=UPI000985285A|nr:MULTISPECIES: SagB/ThcOx family dehydrogenase [unclassified Thermosipho (in: thermotogales)]MBT1247963.1 nitroreductase [Thermosipho sp. 1244]OOC46563.1 nitroreductase [Thermosipho sp. 1223]